MNPRVGVVTFPGSNDDRDAVRAVRTMGADPIPLWHASDDLTGVDAVILPGGFSYGDYLRTGAIARFAPAMAAVRDFALAGGRVLGICNGFQILCEAGLLPGALIRNRSLSFVCRWIHVRVEEGWSAMSTAATGDILTMPVKHGEGQYVAAPKDIHRLEREGQVALRYCSADGVVDDRFNPNGSANAIAGIRDRRGNVVGMMPHPEHAVDPDLGPTGGQEVLGWLVAAVGEGMPA